MVHTLKKSVNPVDWVRRDVVEIETVGKREDEPEIDKTDKEREERRKKSMFRAGGDGMPPV